MGKLSKKKFTQIARLFSGRMRKNFKQLDNHPGTGGGGVGHHTITGSGREHQYFYQDLHNENYEDTALPSSSTTATNDHHHQQQHHNHPHNHQDHPRI